MESPRTQQVRKNLARGRFAKTVAMAGFFSSAGILFGIISPTTVDLVNLRSINYEELSRATTMRAVGVLAGVFLGAAISDRFRDKADIYISISCLTAGVTSIALPWIPSLSAMGLMWGLQGVVYGSINVLTSSVVMAIWGKERASTALSAIHSAYAIGILFAPPLAAPFLSDQVIDDGTSPSVTNTTATPVQVSIGHKHMENGSNSWLRPDGKYETDVYVPYAIAGGVNILVSLAFASFTFCDWRYTRMERILNKTSITDSSELDDDDELIVKSTSENKFELRFFVIFLIILFLVFILLIARDYSLILFIFPIAVESSLAITKNVAARINTTYYAGCALGRIISAIMARFVPIQPLAFSQIGASVVISALLATIGLDGVSQFWILTFFHGFFCSPNNPTMMAWANRYILCSGFVLAIIDAGIGVGGFVGTYVGGVILENYGSVGALNFNLFTASLALGVAVPLQVYAHIHGERYSVPQRDTETKSDAPIMATPSEKTTLLYQNSS